MTAAALVTRLDELLAATPTPPADAEPADLLEALATIGPARAGLITALAAVADGADGAAADPLVRARYQVLEQRDRAWADALTRARTVVGDRLTAVRRTRVRR